MKNMGRFAIQEIVLIGFLASAAAAQNVVRVPTTRPVLANRTAIDALAASEGRALLQPGDSVVVTVFLKLDATGRSSQTVLDSGSGRPAVDSAAVRIGNAMRFKAVHPSDTPLRIRIPIVLKRAPARVK